jgi:hypothetical protein
MMLIVYYLMFVIAGDLADYLIGLIVEREFGSQVSLLVFLALYFVVLWLAWLFAVWMTQPKPAAPSAPRGAGQSSWIWPRTIISQKFECPRENFSPTRPRRFVGGMARPTGLGSRDLIWRCRCLCGIEDKRRTCDQDRRRNRRCRHNHPLVGSHRSVDVLHCSSPQLNDRQAQLTRLARVISIKIVNLPELSTAPPEVLGYTTQPHGAIS